jgi:magnesium-transporting ATPase (P-type)
MWRSILGVVAGLVAWGILVIAGGYAMRAAWPAYVAAAPSMSFDLSMMIARLALSSIFLVVAAWIVQRIARPARYAAIAFGIVMLLAFIPIHIQLWPKFPVWYHAFFLTSLLVIPQLTAMISERATGPTAATVH